LVVRSRFRYLPDCCEKYFPECDINHAVKEGMQYRIYLEQCLDACCCQICSPPAPDCLPGKYFRTAMNLPSSGSGKVLRWAILGRIYGWYGFICDVMKEKCCGN
jgi:hypothetical protein